MSSDQNSMAARAARTGGKGTRVHDFGNDHFARRLEAAQITSTALAEQTDLHAAVSRILDAVCNALDWTAGGFWRVNESGAVLELLTLKSNGRAPELEAASKNLKLERGAGFLGRAWASANLVWVLDFAAESFPRSEAAKRDGLHSAVAFPIRVRGAVRAVMEFYSSEPREPDDAVIGMLTAIGTQIAQFMDRESAREDALASEARKASILQSSLDCIFVMDERGRLTELNPAAERTFGFSRNEAIGAHLADLIIAPELRATLGRDLESVFKGTGDALLGRRAEARAINRAGAEFPIELTVTRFRDRHHNLFTAYVRDISERKRTEVALRASEELLQEANERLAMLVDASEVLASSLDYETTLQNVAGLGFPALGDFGFFDVVESDGKVRRIARALRDPKRQALLDASSWIKSERADLNLCALSTGQSAFHPDIDEAWMEKAASSPEDLANMRALRFHSMISVPLTSHGKALGALTLFFGDSLRKHSRIDLMLAEEVARRAAAAVENARLYETAKRERERAEQANRAKDEFLAAVSHELRTPLTAILGWSHMLRTGQLEPERQQHALATLERNARAQAQLIEDLLDISRIITGKLRLHVKTIEPIYSIEAAIDALRPAAEAKEITLTASLDAEAGPVLADPDRLQQIVWNLLSNAIKFTKKGGRVEVTLARVESNAVITVKDSGQGIKKEFLPHVFEQFRQGEGGTTRAYGGLGLGLAIVRHLVELHGATVRADSDGEEMGATFTVSIPSSAPRVAAVSGGERAVEEIADVDVVQLNGVHVLLIDDERDALELMRAVLEPCGAKVTTAETTREALELVERERPDIVVSDLGMPKEDGFAFVRKLRALPPERGGKTAAVALTAYARAEDRARALTAGFNLHVPKPVEPTELIAVIANLTERIGRTPRP